MPSQRRPKKSLGQHFLRDRNILARMVDAMEIRPGEAVLEIGAGPGDLTAAIAAALPEAAAAQSEPRLTAVELDRELAADLRQRFSADARVRVVQADALTLDVGSLLGREAAFVAAGNLPYNAGTAIVRRLLEGRPRPQRLVVMLQKEVADSVLARPGRMGLLAVSVQVYARGRKVFEVAPGSFFPRPKVRSAVVRLDVYEEPLVPEPELAAFFEVVRAGFSGPRKQLRNSLANGLQFDPARVDRAARVAVIDLRARPGTLAIPDWLRLTRAFYA